MRELGAQSISAQSKLDMAHMKQLGGQSSAYKFGVLTKIVRHMKHRHMNGEDQPLTWRRFWTRPGTVDHLLDLAGF